MSQVDRITVPIEFEEWAVKYLKVLYRQELETVDLLVAKNVLTNINRARFPNTNAEKNAWRRFCLSRFLKETFGIPNLPMAALLLVRGLRMSIKTNRYLWSAVTRKKIG